MLFSDLDLKKCKYYAGIGSRDTPYYICRSMSIFAKLLVQRGLILRSGGAEGADTAFETGCGVIFLSEIYLPWEGFRGKLGIVKDADSFAAAEDIAKKFHPAWDKCSFAAKLLLTRNTFQVLGGDLKSPSDFVICWTKDGKASGGTGQALRIAEAYKIPIFNLYYKDVIKNIAETLK